MTSASLHAAPSLTLVAAAPLRALLLLLVAVAAASADVATYYCVSDGASGAFQVTQSEPQAPFVLLATAYVDSGAVSLPGNRARRAERRRSAARGAGAIFTNCISRVSDVLFLALCKFNAQVAASGTGNLTIVAVDAHDVTDQANVMSAAGFLEGYVNAQLISDSWSNHQEHWGDIAPAVHDFMARQLEYLDDMSGADEPSEYWYNVRMLLLQMTGMQQGYMASQIDGLLSMSRFDFFFLNAAGDLEDIMSALKKSSSVVRAPLPGEPEDLEFYSCSALYRWLPDKSDIVGGHATWRSYTGMLRVFKTYSFPFHAVHNVSFSAEPAFLSSKDDFYVSSAGLLVAETTNSILNRTLYDLLKPTDTVLTWVRSTISTRMSTSGEQWVNTFKRFNSGTYNNQWQVLDYKLFTPGSATLAPGTLWILEQIPGYTQQGDMTSVLQNDGYFPSYNIPRFETVYNMSGYLQHAGNDKYSYSKCPRAQIFKRDVDLVKDVDSFKGELRYCDYLNDPLSLGSPSNCPSSRYDLATNGSAAAFGAIDAKVASLSIFATGNAFEGISGPTTGGRAATKLAPFSWDGQFSGEPHLGQPTTFDFSWGSYGPGFQPVFANRAPAAAVPIAQK